MKSNEKYLETLAKKKIYRVISLLCVVIIFACIIATIITGITGSSYFLPCLALTIVVPFLFYVVLWFGSVLFRTRDKTEMTDNDLKN
ncbi:MAG: hypothetical protein Q4D54_10140 [Eubacteriales bacterium]|nr:hypothetical protein [Lachnospiraceae bacterium]MDO5128085.1 hypothetical protein [Eubacteriales bacterium]